MNKKVAIIIERTNIDLGGAERSIFELKNQLCAQGIDVSILAAEGEKTSEHIKILCQNNKCQRTKYNTFAKALKNHLKTNSYDIIHSVLPFDFVDIYQPRGGSYAESIQQNAVSYQNNFITACKKLTSLLNCRRTAMLNAERRLCKKNNGPIVAALSRYVADQFKKHYKLPLNRIAIISNGVKINKEFDREESEKLRAIILHKLNLKEADNPALLLFAANNFRLKGLNPLLIALQKTQKTKTQRLPYLVIVGNGKPKKYQTLAKKLGIQNRIIFLGAIKNIQNALAITDIAVLPTFYDPASRFILEALAAGKPVITTKLNGATDMFKQDVHGKVIDCPQNTDSLAEAIIYFSNTANIEKTTNAIINDNLKQNISIERVATELISLYETIIEKRRQQ